MAAGIVGLKFDAAQAALIHRKMESLIHNLSDLRPLNQAVGEYLVSSVQNRILSSKTAPDGTKWQPLTSNTIEWKRKIGNVLPSSILFASGDLWRSIHIEHISNSEVRIKSSAEYAAYMQFGVAHVGGYVGKAIEFESNIAGNTSKKWIKRGRTQEARARNNIAGGTSSSEIPARPFLGYSEANKRRMKQMINHYIRTGEP